MAIAIDFEVAVRHRAYEIWEKSGRPHGQDREHWRQAAQEVAKGNGGAVPEPVKRLRKAVKAAAAEATPAPSKKAPARRTK